MRIAGVALLAYRKSLWWPPGPHGGGGVEGDRMGARESWRGIRSAGRIAIELKRAELVLNVGLLHVFEEPLACPRGPSVNPARVAPVLSHTWRYVALHLTRALRNPRWELHSLRLGHGSVRVVVHGLECKTSSTPYTRLPRYAGSACATEATADHLTTARKQPSLVADHLSGLTA
jgi:hypothetical protein